MSMRVRLNASNSINNIINLNQCQSVISQNQQSKMSTTTKLCQNQTEQSQSNSSGSGSNSCRQQQSCNCSNIYSYTLIMALAALLLPITHARHLHDQLALAYDDNASASSSGQLPAWHVDPFHGLAQSFGESSYDTDASSSGSSSSSSSSGGGSFDSASVDSSSGSVESSSAAIESDKSYEEIAQAAVHAAMREMRRQRIRHRRSHNLKFFTVSAQDAKPEWENPCNGAFQPKPNQSKETDTSSAKRKRYLMALRNNTMREYEFMRRSANLDYGTYQHWQHEYTFLPNMTRPTNTVKLKTWYSHMQTFIGSFAYLGKAHHKFRKDHQLSLDDVTFELHNLLISARGLLCEIETTINASYPYSHGAKLNQVSEKAMAERLKFYTAADGTKETDERDLKFTKELYLQYVGNMWKTLRRSLRKQQRNSMERKQNAASSAFSSNSGDSSLQKSSMESSSESGTARVAHR